MQHPNRVSVYEIGYRIPHSPGFDPYSTSYTEVTTVASLGEAQLLLNHLMLDFPSAEWRMVTATYSNPYNLPSATPHGAFLQLMAVPQ